MDNSQNPTPVAPQPPRTTGAPVPPSPAPAPQVSPPPPPPANPTANIPRPTSQPVSVVNSQSGIQMPVPAMSGQTAPTQASRDSSAVSQTQPTPPPLSASAAAQQTSSAYSPAPVPPPPASPPQQQPSQASVPNQSPPPPPPQTTPYVSPNPAPENPTLDPVNSGSDGIKRIFKILAVILVFALIIGGAVFAYLRFFRNDPVEPVVPTPRSGGGATEVTLQYWGLWEPESVYREVFDDFETANPGVKIEYTQQSPVEYRERLWSDLVKGDGPDIFRYHNTWVPMFRNQLAYLPEAVMSEADYQTVFYPVIYEDMRTTEGLVGVPLMIDGLGLYYNKTMFSTASIPVPATWDQLRQAARSLTITNQNTLERGGIALGVTENVEHYADILGLMLLQNGANPADPTTSLAKDAIDFYRIFVTADRVWNTTLPQSTFAFANERTAMMIAPSWRANEVAALNPELDFAITPLPQLPDSNVAWASYWVEGVSNQSKNELLSWQLLEFMSQPESLRKIYTASSQERLIGNPFPRVDMAEQLIGDPYAGAYIEQAYISQSWPMVNRTFDNGINDRIVKYYEDALNAGAGPADLQTAASGITQVLSQHGVSP